MRGIRAGAGKTAGLVPFVIYYSNFAGAKWPSARWQSVVPGTEKDIRQSIRPDIPMSP